MKISHEITEESKAFLTFLVDKLKDIKVTVVVEIKK